MAEIPLMVVGLKKLAADPKQTSSTLLALTNAFYVFFASVYLGGVRLISSLLFVRPDVEMV